MDGRRAEGAGRAGAFSSTADGRRHRGRQAMIDASRGATSPGEGQHGSSGDLAAKTLATGGHAIEGGSGYQRREPLVVTALFLSPDAVDRALDALYVAGVPRDLMEVVTSRYAGAGALVGFIGGLVFSLLMLLWPGIDAPGGMAPVALFGPNVGTTAGAAI